MPEMHFRVRWPDGTRETCYSPSRVVRDYFVAGESYTLADFLARCRAALSAASERVREKYGVPCGRAASELARLEARGRGFADMSEARVTVEALAAAEILQD